MFNLYIIGVRKVVKEMGETFKIYKVSEFLENEVPEFVLGAFLSRYVILDNYIFTLTNYRASRVMENDEYSYEDSVDEYLEKLRKISVPFAWIKNNELEGRKPPGLAYIRLFNDLNLTGDQFFSLLYRKVVSESDWLFEDGLNESKRLFISGFMELRGSIDTTANYLATDYFYKSKFEAKKARILIDYCNVPINSVNLNFRELQEQFLTGKNRRNTQFRLALDWYVMNIGLLNKYKACIYKKSHTYIEEKTKGFFYIFTNSIVQSNARSEFDNRLKFYLKNIFDTSKNDVQKLRNELSLDNNIETMTRNKIIVETVRLLNPDECDCCKDKYNIKDRTFISKTTQRPYFEIHHVISLGQNKELDVEDNLAKLCPVCHRALKKNVSEDEYQEALIKEILNNKENISDFTKGFLNEFDEEKLVKIIRKNLK